METAERGLAAILGWEIEQELTEFVSREGFKSSRESGRGATSAYEQYSSNGSRENNDITSSPGPGRTHTGSAQDFQTTRSNGRAPSVVSGRQGPGGDNLPTIASEKEKSKSGGLFSAFKVGKLDRRKSTSQHVSRQQQNFPTNGTFDAPEDTDSYNSLRTPTTGVRERQDSSRTNGESDDFRPESTLRPNPPSRRSNRDSFMPSLSNLGLKRKTTLAVGGDRLARNASPNQPLSPSGVPMESPEMFPATGAGRVGTAGKIGSANPFGASMGGGDRLTPAFEQVSMFGDEPASVQGATSRDFDEQGYSMPPKDYNRPIGASGGDGSGSGANLMDMADSDDEYVQFSHHLQYIRC